MKYVMSDLHGATKRFHKMLKQININLLSEDYLYIDGDIIDRGKDSIRLLFEIYEMQKKYGDHVIVTVGNHEFFLYQYATGDLSERRYVAYGGEDTIREFKELNNSDKQLIVEFIEGLPVDVEIESNKRGRMKMVHSGIHEDHIIFNDDKTINVNKSIESALRWDKNQYLLSGYLQRESPAYIYKNLDMPLIVGHTPTMFLPDVGQPIICAKPGYKVIMLDCGAGHKNGRLGCIRIEDEKIFYVD